MLGLPPRRIPGKRPLRLEAAAFGKHPAWKDHIDEDSLVATPTPELKFYEAWLHGRVFEEHLGRNAFAGMPDQDVTDIDHLIVRRLGGGTSVALVWQSTDYSRRSMFPMVVCVDADGLGVEATLREVLPALRDAARKVRDAGRALRNTIDAADPALGGTVDTAETRKLVRAAIDELRATLVGIASRLNGAQGDESLPDAGELLRSMRAHPDAGPADLGLARTLYRLERLREPDPGAKPTTRGESLRHWRLPKLADTSDEGVRRWFAALSFFADPALEYTFAAPERRAWVDLYTGTPDAGSLEKLRLSDHAEPPENRTAYGSVDDAFVSSTSRTLDAWVSGDAPAAAGASALSSPASDSTARAMSDQAPDRPVGRKPESLASRWRNWFIGGAGLVALGALVIIARHDPGTPDKPVVLAGRTGEPAAPTPVPAQTAPPTAPAASSPTPVAAPAAAAASKLDAPTAAGAPTRELAARAVAMESELKALTARYGALASGAPEVQAALEAFKRKGSASDVERADAALKAMATDADKLWRDRLKAASAMTLRTEALRPVLASVVALAEKSTVPADASRLLERDTASIERIDEALASALETGEPACKGVLRAAVETNLTKSVAQLATATAQNPGKPIDEGAFTAATLVARQDLRRLQDLSQRAIDAAQRVAAGASYSEVRGSDPMDALPADVKPEYVRAVEECLGHSGAQLLAEARSVRGTAGDLLDLVRTATPDRLGIARTAYARVSGAESPLTATDLDRIVAAHGHLMLLIDRVGGPEAPARSAQARQLTKAMIASVARGSGLDDDAVRGARSALGAIGATVTDADLGEVRRNFSLLAARERLSGAVSPESARAAVKELLGNLPPDDPDTKSLTRAIEGASATTAPNEPSRGTDFKSLLSNVGPGRAGWSIASVTSEGTSVTYSSPGGDELTFHRVEADGSGSYVCETELSVSVALKVISSKYAEFADALPRLAAGNVDSRQGVRTWTISTEDGDRLIAGSGSTRNDLGSWLGGSIAGSFAPGTAPPPPTGRSPFQAVSPALGARIAAKLGCRFPTTAEWLAARAMTPDSAEPWNRRDRSLQAQIEAAPPRSRLAIDANSLQSGASSAAPAVTFDDGTPFFLTVDGGPATAKFKHIVGNVAEWVFDGAAELDAAVAGGGTPGELERLMRQIEKLKVAGASALSGVGIDADQPVPVASLPKGARAYTDVGLRLAFSAPVVAQPPGRDRADDASVEAIRQAVEQMKYR